MAFWPLQPAQVRQTTSLRRLTKIFSGQLARLRANGTSRFLPLHLTEEALLQDRVKPAPLTPTALKALPQTPLPKLNKAEQAPQQVAAESLTIFSSSKPLTYCHHRSSRVWLLSRSGRPMRRASASGAATLCDAATLRIARPSKAVILRKTRSCGKADQSVIALVSTRTVMASSAGLTRPASGLRPQRPAGRLRSPMCWVKRCRSPAKLEIDRTIRSPNFGERRDGLRPELVVIHYTAMRDCAGAAKALCDPVREVSAHYLIGRDGAVLELVDPEMRAWHAGTGEWRGADDVNSRSIGIELDNDGLTPFSAPLMASLEALLLGPKGRDANGVLSGLLAAYGIGPQGVIGHSDMAPGRKIDPGRRFDWKRLARQGAAVWSEAKGDVVDAEAFRRDAIVFGYGEMADDLLLEVVRMRFRPWAHGPLDGIDCALMADLAARFGVDRASAGA